ncbi:MAG TPA: double zinc ribbon domain-containing protein [Gaiellaceae bacterium]|nr:double zinc ribbon domain-containing protein [Gaiellaceae bacterium]
MLLDLVLPRRCVSCARLGENLCAGCRAALPFLLGTHCARCGAPTAWPVLRCRECAGRRLAFASARAAVAYQPPVPAVVGAWKERGLRGLAELAADAVCAVVACPAADGIAFVPADGDRSVRRGHHPAERLALELGRRWSLPVVRALGRTRAPRPQRGLSLPARRRNVRGAFVARPRVPRRLVLVDDVYTTGSTATAAASALRKAGAVRVDVVTFARAVRSIQSAAPQATAISGGVGATPGEGQERRGHRLDS